MLSAGMSKRRIAAALGCHASTILRLNQRLLQTGSVKDRPRTGRPKVTTPAQDAQTQAHTVYPVTPNAGMFYERGYKQ